MDKNNKLLESNLPKDELNNVKLMDSGSPIINGDKEKSGTNMNKIVEKATVPDSVNIAKDQADFCFYIKGGKYFTKERRGKIEVVVELSNFVMKSMFHLVNGTNDSQRIIYIQRYSGEKHFVEVRASEMKPESFETILKSKRCTFLGSAYNLKQVFSRIMDEETEAIILHVLGWNEEFKIYIFADSVYQEKTGIQNVDDLGIIDTGKQKFYLPAFGFSNIHNEDYKTERLYKFQAGETDFKTWAELLFKSFGHNAGIGILYTILSIFRDIIFSEVGFFPFLFLFGDFGTGKTSFTEKLLSLFGKDVIGTPLNNATIVALSRLVSSRSNSLFYFKEYTNETDSHAEDFILTAYDGAGRTTGIKSMDSKTKSFPVRSALIFDGNHMPTQKSAILSRMILLNFESSKFTVEETDAFNKLKSLSDLGFGNVLIEVLQLRTYFENNFPKYYKTAISKLRQELTRYDERTIKHAALLYTAVSLLYNKLSFPYTCDEAFLFIKENTFKLNNLLRESSAVNVFWESFSYNVKKGLLPEHTAYRLKVDEKNNLFDQRIIQIKFQNIYPQYVKYCRDSNIRFLDSNSLKMILTSKSNDFFLPAHQKGRGNAYTDKIFGSCYQFKTNPIPGGIEINGVEIQL
jgi:hypothetical protein